MASNKNHTDILNKADVRLCRLHSWPNFQGFGFVLGPHLGPPHLTCMIESNSPAEAGGLRIRDVILAVNNKKMSDTDFNQVQTMIKAAYDTNTRIDLLVVKQKYYEIIQKRKIQVDQTLATVTDTPAVMPADYVSFPRLTLRVCSIWISENDTAFGFDVANGIQKIGLYIEKVFSNSQASHAGLRNNDRIIEINGENVDQKSSRSIKSKLRKIKKTNALILLVADTETYDYYIKNNLKMDSAAAKGPNTSIFSPIVQNQNKDRRKNPNTRNGTIQYRSGDLTKEKVDAIVVSSTSDRLIQNVLQEAGSVVKTAYEKEMQGKNNKSICTNGGNLACQRIYFVPCLKMSQSTNKWTFRSFVSEAISTAINDNTTRVQSMAFPAIGCGQYNCDPDFVAKTLVAAVAYEFEKQPSLQLDIYFVIQSHQKKVLDAFKNECLAWKNQGSAGRMPLPLNVRAPHADEQGFLVEKRLLSRSSDEYTMVLDQFLSTMTSSFYKEIVRIEMIWHKRWYIQYRTHRAEFYQRLKKDTEKFLFHGCSETAANNIIEKGFNRSYAGKHGTSYGYGVYFSSKANYSHSYTIPNTKGERCMFFARVLVGRTTMGNSSIKICPTGYDTTTDGTHIYVIYHDAQAFGGYLITYK